MRNAYKGFITADIISKEVPKSSNAHYMISGPPVMVEAIKKALGTIEGVALSLDPDFNMITQAAPFIKEIKLSRLHLERITSDIYGIASDLLVFTKQFPKDVLEIARLLLQRKLSFTVEHQGLEEMLATHDQISNRLSFSIIIAALVGIKTGVISSTHRNKAKDTVFRGFALVGVSIPVFWMGMLLQYFLQVFFPSAVQR